MSQVAGLQDFRQAAPPADTGIYQFPASILVFEHTFAGTTYAVAIRSGERGWVLVDINTDAFTVIQSALNGLTAGRTWKERVVIMGNFSMSGETLVPSYIVIDNRAAKFTLNASVNANIFLNSGWAGAGNVEIEIIGGEYDGNGANQDAGAAHIDCISMRLVTGLRIKDVKTHDAGYTVRDGFGVSVEACETVFLNNIHSYNNGTSGVNITASSDVNFGTIITANNGRFDVGGDGVWINSNEFTGDCIIDEGSPHAVRIEAYDATRSNINVGLIVGKDNTRHALMVDKTAVGDWYLEHINIGSVLAIDSTRQGVNVYAQASGRVRHVNIGKIVVKHCGSDGFAYGINIENVNDMDIGFVDVFDSYGHGIQLNGCNRVNLFGGNVINNALTAANSDGINVYNCDSCTIAIIRSSGANHRYGLYEHGTSDNNLIIGNDFRGNDTGALYLVGTSTWAFHNKVDGVSTIAAGVVIPELRVYVPDPDGTIGTHPAVVLTDGNDITVRFQLQVPLDFFQLISAEVIIVAGGTGNLRRSVATNWGVIGAAENYNTQTDAIAAGQIAVTVNRVTAFDIAAAFTNLAAGDLVGIEFTREASNALDTVNANCYFLGLRVRYI